MQTLAQAKKDLKEQQIELKRLHAVAEPYQTQQNTLVTAKNLAKDHVEMHLNKARKHNMLMSLFSTIMIGCVIGLYFQPFFPVMTTLLFFSFVSGIASIANRVYAKKEKNYALAYQEQADSYNSQIKGNAKFLTPIKESISQTQEKINELEHQVFELAHKQTSFKEKHVAQQIIEHNQQTSNVLELKK